MSHDEKELLLGKHTEYVFEYDKSLIFPISRAQNRAKLTMPDNKVNNDLPFYGFDVWTGYEVSWLNLKGKPQVAIVEFVIPAQSSYIVESKSFKLYLNSFNQTRLADRSELESRLVQDLSEGFGAPIEVRIFDVMSFPISQQSLGFGIDDLDIEVSNYSPNPDLLTCEANQSAQETLHSHLLKSNCPVTGQPDWATVIISYEGSKINHESLLQYIISYRNHDDFHEHCVEQIFCDLLSKGQFKQLSVTARYTRRGGLDINPTRSLTPINPADGLGRLARQ
jgi:7-cyano-7-deazaguanine reductase